MDLRSRSGRTSRTKNFIFIAMLSALICLAAILVSMAAFAAGQVDLGHLMLAASALIAAFNGILILLYYRSMLRFRRRKVNVQRPPWETESGSESSRDQAQPASDESGGELEDLGDPHTALMKIEELERRIAGLQETEISSRFIAGLAHEINTPLGNLSMALEMLSQGMSTRAVGMSRTRALELVQAIQDGKDRIQGIVQLFREFSAKDQLAKPGMVDVRYLSEVLAGQLESKKGGRVRWSVSVPEGFYWPYGTQVLIQALEPLMANVYDTALDGVMDTSGDAVTGGTPATARDAVRDAAKNVDRAAARDGAPDVARDAVRDAALGAARDAQAQAEAQISCEIGDRKLTISVSSPGAEIPEQVRQHMYDPFFTTRRGRGQVGLGLFFCLSTVRSLGGQLTYHRSGEMNVFALELSNFETAVVW